MSAYARIAAPTQSAQQQQPHVQQGSQRTAVSALLLDGAPWLMRGVAYAPTPVGVAPRADADDDAATEGRSADGDDDDDEGASRAVDDDASADDEGDDDEEYEDELGLSSDGD